MDKDNAPSFADVLAAIRSQPDYVDKLIFTAAMKIAYNQDVRDLEFNYDDLPSIEGLFQSRETEIYEYAKRNQNNGKTT